MNKQEIINASIIEQSILEDELKDEDPELEFFRNFFTCNYSTSIEKLLEVPYTDFMIAATIGALGSKMKFETIRDCVNSFSSIIENTTATDFYIVVLLIDTIHKNNEVDRVVEYFSDSNKKRSIRYLTDFFTGKSKLIIEPLKELLEDTNTMDSNIVNLIKLYELKPKFINRVLTVIHQLKSMNEEQSEFLEEVDYFEQQTGLKMKKNERKSAVKKVIKCSYNVDAIKKVLKLIYDFYIKTEADRKELEKTNKRLISIYDKFVNEFSVMFTVDEIKNYSEVIKRVPDTEIRESVLRLVYEHNKNEYEKIDIYHKELSKNSKIHYLALLKENNISKEEININRIMRNSYEVFSEMLKVLTNMVKDKDTIIKALEISNLDTIKYLKELKDKGVILESTLKENNTLFDSTSDKFYMLNENVKVCSKYNLNPANFSSITDILLTINIDSNLSILNDYDLIKYIKNSKDYSYLGKTNLSSLIDKIIELGYEEYLLNNLDLLNEDNWDRLYVLKDMNYEIENQEELLEFLRVENFIVPDIKLDDYIANIVPYLEFTDKKCDMECLNKYSNTSRSYMINGVVLSKNRVQRNYSEDNNKSLLEVLVKDGIYSKDEVYSLKEEINNKILLK